ncbi:MAG: hypothetical protein ACXVCE_09730, partial [Bacteriovorax sp.]
MDDTVTTETAKRYTKGMGQAVADRTINRKIIHHLKQPEIITIALPSHENLSLNEEVEIYCRSKGYLISHFETLKKGQITLHITAK